MSIKRPFVLALVLLVAWPVVSAAQVINRPQRGYRGLFGGGRQAAPNEVRQEVVFTLNVLGGHDDNATAGAGAETPPSLATPAGAGTTANIDAGLTYFAGTVERSFQLAAGFGTSAYRDIPLDASEAFSLNLGATTGLGRRGRLTVSENLSYSSQYRLDSPLTSTLPFEDRPTLDSAVFGLGSRGQINSTTSVDLEQRVSRGDSLQGGYGYTSTTFTSGDSNGYRVHRLNGRYNRQISRWWQANARYEFGTTRFGFGVGDEGRSMRQHSVIGGVQWQRRLSPRRTMTFGADGGAFSLSSVSGDTPTPYTRWAPFVDLTTQLDLGRAWNLGGTYRRGADTLEGLSTEAFINDAGTITLSGLVSRRIDLSFIGGVARGAHAAEGGANGQYLTSTGSAQVRIAVNRMLSTVVSYHYYHYKFDNVVLLDPQIGSQFDRNAIRIGISLWLPLYGSFGERR
jgi:hypothetical protein